MKTFHVLVIAALAALPLVSGMPYVPGVPKPFCETAADRAVHVYGPGTGYFVWLGLDGSVGDCDGDGAYDPYEDWDRHHEYAQGGAYLVVGAAGTQCYGVPADHPSHPFVTVVDDVLGSDVTFVVEAPHGSGPEGECVPTDHAVDAIECVGACRVAFPPGPNGDYVVYVAGTTGRITATA